MNFSKTKLVYFTFFANLLSSVQQYEINAYALSLSTVNKKILPA